METDPNSLPDHARARIQAAWSSRQRARLLLAGLVMFIMLAGLVFHPHATTLVEAGCEPCPTPIPTLEPTPEVSETGDRIHDSVGGAVVYNISDTNETQIYSNTGVKLAGLAFDDVAALAAAGVGATISIPSEDGSETITITHQGGGHFTGSTSEGDFSFTRSDVAGISFCDGFYVELAETRADEATGYEGVVADAVYEAIRAACG